MVNRPILRRAEHAESPCRSVETIMKEVAVYRYAQTVLIRIFLSTCTGVLIDGRPSTWGLASFSVFSSLSPEPMTVLSSSSFVVLGQPFHSHACCVCCAAVFHAMCLRYLPWIVPSLGPPLNTVPCTAPSSI